MNDLLKKWLLPGVCLLIIVSFLVRNLPWHLDDYDQAKQAYTSYEMVTQGHWWYQHTPSDRIATKPPLAGWLSAGLYESLRHFEGDAWAWSWRLPSLVSALLILGLLLDRTRSDTWAATVACAAFGLNLLAPRIATLVRTDMLLTLWIFLIGLKVFDLMRDDRTYQPMDRLYLCGLFLAAMLTKGPIVYAFVLPGIALLMLLKTCRGAAVSARRHLFELVLASVPALVIFAVWVGIGAATDRDFYDQVVLKEFLGRFTTGEEAVHHPQPIYFYLPHLLHKFAPWFVIIVALLSVPGIRRRLFEHREWVWLVAWGLGALIVMSLVPSKRVDRIFPIVPPLSLAVGFGIAALTEPWRNRVSYIALGIAALMTVGQTAFELATNYRAQADRLVHFGAQVQELATAKNTHFVTMRGRDEGLIMYVDQARFADESEALMAWHRGDGLVLDDRDLEKLKPQLNPYEVALQTLRPAAKNGSYYFIVPGGE